MYFLFATGEGTFKISEKNECRKMRKIKHGNNTDTIVNQIRANHIGGGPE